MIISGIAGITGVSVSITKRLSSITAGIVAIPEIDVLMFFNTVDYSSLPKLEKSVGVSKP